MPFNPHVDEEASLNGTTPLTATGVGSVATFEVGDGRLAPGTGVQFNVTAIDTANADETYFGNVEAATDAAFTVPVTVGSVEILTIGNYFAAFSNEQAGVIYPHVRVNFVLAGTTPSITAPARIAGV